MRTCGLALLALIACAVTGGEDDVPEIVVTAQLRDTALENVPSSVTVLTENVIAQREAQHLEEIVAASPNVNLSAEVRERVLFKYVASESGASLPNR